MSMMTKEEINDILREDNNTKRIFRCGICGQRVKGKDRNAHLRQFSGKAAIKGGPVHPNYPKGRAAIAESIITVFGR